jgi:uncharacterized MnhB-related membrane protein
MQSLMIWLLGIIMITAALIAIRQKNLLNATIAVGVVSLFASILYLVLAAPDVAMTEAAIGAGLGTVIFLYTLKKTEQVEVDDD